MAHNAKTLARKDDGLNRPQRLCALSRVHRPIEELIRFVVAPDDTIVPDLSNRLPGRGIWITATHQSVAQAVKTGSFQRSAKRNVKVAPDLADLVDRLMLTAATQSLALTNKAGFVTTGFSKVEAAIGRDEAIALLHASDAATDGAERLDRKFTAVKKAHGKSARFVRSLTNEQLSLALGRENVVHAAIMESGVARKFLTAAERLRRFRAGFDDNLTVMTPQIAKVEHG